MEEFFSLFPWLLIAIYLIIGIVHTIKENKKMRGVYKMFPEEKSRKAIYIIAIAVFWPLDLLIDVS